MFLQYGELGPLAAEIGLPVWGTPANFNGFWVLALWLHWRRSTEVNQTLHNVLSVSWVGTLCIPERNFTRCKIHFMSKSCTLLYWQHYCTVLEWWASAKLCGIQQRVPPIFGRVAIALGIGLHSSLCLLCLYVVSVWHTLFFDIVDNGNILYSETWILYTLNSSQDGQNLMNICLKFHAIF